MAAKAEITLKRFAQLTLHSRLIEQFIRRQLAMPILFMTSDGFDANLILIFIENLFLLLLLPFLRQIF